MSVISQVVLRADDELRYPTLDELQSIKDFLQTGQQRIAIANTLKENETKIVEKASRELWKIHPDYIAPVAMPMGRDSAPSVCGTTAGICA